MSQRSEIVIAFSVAAVFLLLGLGMLLLGWNLYREQQELAASGIETEGRIVGFERIVGGSDNRLHGSFPVPIVKFTTKSGSEVRVVGTVAERFWTDHQNGKAVTVVYDTANPENAKINELADIWFAPAMFLLIGLVANIEEIARQNAISEIMVHSSVTARQFYETLGYEFVEFQLYPEGSFVLMRKALD